MEKFKVETHIHLLDGGLDSAVILQKVGDNQYVDDKYGIIQSMDIER